jgi:hypothetical protein
VPDSEVAYDAPGDPGWFYYEKMWQIEPQPAGETISATIYLPAAAVLALDEAAVDTYCIPEPLTAAALLLAAPLLLRRRGRHT